ncbi:hypothetical protein SAMN05192545_2867 [Maribacter dokdonensis]|uniref:Bacteriophage CI repressor helix-turn-helix domain-containing protein n=1 Tax=Maribacter dokdonensis TaxID=320912 RepID=A0ABY0UTA9_9FLAO|nr:hypothetical protein [Maribacter dokdonensis]SDT14479.1 hypothetical protein SAMN05192545_2867 [Maribacter dokdonensis]
MKTINEKLVQFADSKGLSQYKFCKETGLSDGALRGSRSIGVESLAKIKEKYPDLNLDWIMFDKGPMLLSDAELLKEPSAFYQRNLTIDEVVDNRIDSKLDALREVMAAYIRQDIIEEIENAKKEIKKNKK